MSRLAILLACVAAAFGLFYLQAVTPAPEPADTSYRQFSAGRAMADVRVIAAVPHPTGSPANAAVRDYLVGRMTELGLSPQIQHAESHWAQPDGGLVFGGTVENVIGLLPGTDHSLPALALMAHYDSVPGSPGAADDAAGVASVLEIVRGIKAVHPARDVIVLITDGEEAGLLGAHAFYGQHPLAGHVGFVINFEARGGGGRAHMFQSGADNAGAVRLFSAKARRPQSNSLTVQVYKLMPNDTDFTVSDARHVPGLNLAFLGRQFDYHSPSSTVAALDQGALQSLGEQAFGPALRLASDPALPKPGPDLVYGNLPIGDLVLSYPAWGGWVLLLAAAALTAVGAARARQGKALAWRDLWRGLGAGLLLLLGGMVALELTRRATGVGSGWMEYRPLLARFPLFEAAMGLTLLGVGMMIPAAMARGKLRAFGVGFFAAAGLIVVLLTHGAGWPMTLGVAVAAAALALLVFGRDASVCGTWTGLLLTGIGATLALQIAMPTAALIVGWPLLAGAAVNALMAGGRDRRPLITALACALIVLTLAWDAFFAHLLMQGLDLPEAPALILWTGAMVAWPLLWPSAPNNRLSFVAPAAVILLGLGLALFLRVTSPWDARHPRAEQVYYAIDALTGHARRISTEPADAWTRAVLTADGGAVTNQPLPTFRRPLPGAPARPIAFTAPVVTLDKAADGLVTLRFTPPPGTTDLELWLATKTAVGQVTLNGQPTAILGKPGQRTVLLWRGGDPLSLSFRPAGPGALDIQYADILGHWPAEARPLPPMPADAMGFDTSGSTLLTAQQSLAW